MQKIQFSGKEYGDLADMPPAERQAYEQLMSIFSDNDQDGVPDIFQGDIVSNIMNAITTSVYVDGKWVSGLDAMSPVMRTRFEQGMVKLKALGLISQLLTTPGYSQSPQGEAANIHPSPPIIQSSSVHQEDTHSRWAFVLVIMIALGICALGAVVFWLVRG